MSESSASSPDLGMSPSPPPSHHSGESLSKVDSKKRPSASTESGQPAKITKRRAARACVSCRARKVRCDVVEGAPCGNCRWDNVEVRFSLHHLRLRLLCEQRAGFRGDSTFTHTRSHARLRRPFPFRHIARGSYYWDAARVVLRKAGVSSAESLTCEYGTSGGSLTRTIHADQHAPENKEKKRNHIKLTLFTAVHRPGEPPTQVSYHLLDRFSVPRLPLPTLHCPDGNFPKLQTTQLLPPRPGLLFPAQRCAAPVASAHASPVSHDGAGVRNDKPQQACLLGWPRGQPAASPILQSTAIQCIVHCLHVPQARPAGRSSRADHLDRRVRRPANFRRRRCDLHSAASALPKSGTQCKKKKLYPCLRQGWVAAAAIAVNILPLQFFIYFTTHAFVMAAEANSLPERTLMGPMAWVPHKPRHRSSARRRASAAPAAPAPTETAMCLDDMQALQAAGLILDDPAMAAFLLRLRTASRLRRAGKASSAVSWMAMCRT